ncbi:hypothetical protein ADL26_18060, partial [Thermoactinomyces vulgaris]
AVVTAAVAAAAEGGQNGVVRGLLVVVAVEEQRVVVAPRVLVGHAPDGDAGAAGHGHAGPGDGLVGRRLAGALADVELGDLHGHAEVGEALEVGLVAAQVLVGGEVGLEADAVD